MRYLLACNEAYVGLLRNSVTHLRRFVAAEDIIVALPRSFDVPDLLCPSIVIPADLPAHEQFYRRNQWGDIVRWKLSVIVRMLETEDILYIDPDVIVFTDIRRHLPVGNWDVCAQTNVRGTPCMGILAAKSCSFSRSFLRSYVPIMSDDLYIGSKWDSEDDRLRLLPSDVFPVGVCALNKSVAVCYHYNWIRGMDRKKERMQADGLWSEK